MPEAAKIVGTPKSGEVTQLKEKKAPSVARTNFSKMYPEDAALSILAKENPKKKGSKSAARFEGYTGASTVGGALANGVTYQDIAYDLGRGFIKVG